MDRTEHTPRTPAPDRPCAWGVERGEADWAERPVDARTRARPRLALISTKFKLAEPAEAPGPEWAEALARLAQALDIEIERAPREKQPSLMERARQVIGSAGEAAPPTFAPWQCWSPTAFQGGVADHSWPRARWIASYLFDCGAGRPGARPCIDLALLSPLPSACEQDGAGAPGLARRGVLKAMIDAALSEDRRKLAIILPEAHRNAIATALIAACDAPTRSRLEIEILPVEQAVVRIQASEVDWEAIIVMPELRGILHAMLSQWSGVSAPWPMLWHDRGLAMVTSEAIGRASGLALDAGLLMQGLALAARQGGCGPVAQRLHESWATLRDRGLVTPSRPSPAPYVNEVSEAEFVDLALATSPQQGRSLPAWSGIASGRSNEASSTGPARLALVSSS